MPKRKIDTVQLRTTVPTSAADRLERLADRMTITVPDLLRFMITMQLVEWENRYMHRVAVPVADEDAPVIVQALQLQEDSAESKHDHPGFRPGGKPRSALGEEVHLARYDSVRPAPGSAADFSDALAGWK